MGRGHIGLVVGSVEVSSVGDSYGEEVDMRWKAVNLYQGALWEFFRSYRVALTLLRAGELLFILIRRIFIRHTVAMITRGDTSLLRKSLEELGPTFIKFGQLMSMRPEIPPSIREDLQSIQESVNPMDFKVVRKLLQKEIDAMASSMGKPGSQSVEDVFSQIDEKPIAAASLGQVHRAVLRKEQEEVALKVQRPNLQGIIEMDILIIDTLVFLIKNLLPQLRKKTDLALFTHSFGDNLRREVDFFLEGKNTEKMGGMVAMHPMYSKYIKIANVNWDYTTSKLLVMEFIRDYHRFDSPKGTEILERVKIPELSLDRPYHLLWVTGFFLAEHMMYHGNIYADPHFGNIYFMEDGRLFICDFGMMEFYTQEQRDYMYDFFSAMVFHRSPSMTVESLMRVHLGKPEDVNKAGMLEMISNVMSRRVALSDPSAGASIEARFPGTISIITECLYVLSKYGLVLPTWFCMFFKLLLYVEEIAVTFIPDIDLATWLLPPLKAGMKDKIARGMEPLNATNAVDSFRGLVVPTTGPLVADQLAKLVVERSMNGCREIPQLV